MTIKRRALKKRIDVTRCNRLFVRANGAFMASLPNGVRVSKGDQKSPTESVHLVTSGKMVDVRESLAIDFPDVGHYREKIKNRMIWIAKQSWCVLKFREVDPGIKGVCGLSISGPASQIQQFLSDLGDGVRVNQSFVTVGTNGLYQMRSRKYDKRNRSDDLNYSNSRLKYWQHPRSGNVYPA